jgi:RNA polymerase sigma-70 factor (ECF subfamily)
VRGLRDRSSRSPEVADDASDEALIVRRAQQSPRDFEPLYLRYRDAVINYCFYRLGDHGDAEDAASAVFVKALHALPAFSDRDGSFRSWLFRIAHNEVVDRRRYRLRHPMLPFDRLTERPATDRSPEELASDADTRMRIRALLSTLPPREREVLELRAAELDTNQIASVLGVTAHNVRSIQCRALARLRSLIGEADRFGLEAIGD